MNVFFEAIVFSSLNSKSQRVLYAYMSNCSSFTFMVIQCSIIWLYLCLFVHFLSVRCMSCFQLLVITKPASVSILVHVCYLQFERFSRPQGLLLGRELLSYRVWASRNLLDNVMLWSKMLVMISTMTSKNFCCSSDPRKYNFL